MWRNIVEPDRPQMTIWYMPIACWLPKATNTLSEYVIVIAFPQQKWLYERAPVLPFTCIASLVLSELHLFGSSVYKCQSEAYIALALYFGTQVGKVWLTARPDAASNKFSLSHGHEWHAVAQLVDALRYKRIRFPKVSLEFFHWPNRSGLPGVDSGCDRNEYQEYVLGVKAAGT